MKIAVMAAAIFIAGTGITFAADMPVKARPLAPPPVFTWSGCYVGGNAGWIGGDGHQTTAPAGNYLTAIGGAAPPNAAGTGDNPGDIVALTDSYGIRDSGGLIGVQAGCNRQNGRFVFGVEGDWAWTSLKNTTNAAFAAFPNIGSPAFTDAARTELVTTKLDSLATFRGRAGFVWNQIFLYGTGGLAVGDVRSNTNVTFGTFPVLPVYNGAVHIGSGSSWQVGWTAGVGGEYALNSNWSVKAEYLYVDLGTFTYFSPLVAAVPAFAPGYSWRTSVNERDHIVRVGLNYHFSGPVVAKY
jgi:outer membrane immunogenic protein